MDNLTHTLFGAALAKTRLGRLAPLAAPALLVAANFPDLDIVTRLWSKDAYLIHHRGLTHSALGVLLQIPLLMALFYFSERGFRAFRKRREPERAADNWRGLALAIAAGLLSHPLLDYLNTYGVRPWLPFDGTWYYGDMAFIVDPWLWLLFGGAACLAGPRSYTGHVAWAVAAASCTYILYASGRAPLFVRMVWPLAVAALVWGRWRGVGLQKPRKTLGVAGGLAALYLGGLALASHLAWRESRAALAAHLAAGETILAYTCSPQPADPFSWLVCAETRERIYLQQVHLGGSITESRSFARDLDDPLVRRAAASPDARAWHVFARHPFAAVRNEGGRTRVYLLDARYQTFAAPNWCSTEIDLDEP